MEMTEETAQKVLDKALQVKQQELDKRAEACALEDSKSSEDILQKHRCIKKYVYVFDLDAQKADIMVRYVAIP